MEDTKERVVSTEVVGRKQPEVEGNHKGGEYFGDILKRRANRRDILKGVGAMGVSLVVSSALDSRDAEAFDPGGVIRFKPIQGSTEDKIVVPDNYDHNVVIRWGDPLFPFPEGKAFDIDKQDGARQAGQFGFNCDFVGFFPLGRFSRFKATRGLLAVNHEYTTGSEMFPGYDENDPTHDQVDAEIAAHGMTIVQVRRAGEGWKYKRSSYCNRRITGSTPIEITGPLRGHALMQTPDDPTGTEVLGMLNNCAGGKTPWGTVLTCEENFDQYFSNYTPGSQGGLSDRIAAPTGASDRKWENYYDRYDLSKQPTEYHRFGYVVEIDPYDPTFKPRKRTALGRFKHEGAFPAVTKSGHVAVYSGDDARFEYVYKFVTSKKYNPHRRRRNFDLLDAGSLYVARFHDDGTGEWVALPNDPESILNTRGTADGLGATKMDRPEDIDVSPVTGKVYLAMTNNTNRRSEAADPGEVAANPRSPADTGNRWGHVIEITEDGNDNGALTFRWEIFILCGDPAVQGGVLDVDDLVTGKETYFAGFDPSLVSPMANPDNLLIDDLGNLWIMTDGQPSNLGGVNDGVFAVPTEGADRGFLRQFVSAVPGGELASGDFASDYKTLFCSIQHPGEGDGIPNPTSVWPDGENPPKPSVIAVWNTRRGRRIGDR